MRKQFLPYFTDGVLIGNCLLTEPSPGVRLSAYVLPDRVLAIVLNQGAEGELTFGYDLAGWLPGLQAGPQPERDKVACTHFDESGRQTLMHEVPASGTLRTGRLKPLEMTLLEFRAK